MEKAKKEKEKKGKKEREKESDLARTCTEYLVHNPSLEGTILSPLGQQGCKRRLPLANEGSKSGHAALDGRTGVKQGNTLISRPLKSTHYYYYYYFN